MGIEVSDLTCVVHKAHEPKCHEVDVHHIWPQGKGGPDTDANKVPICPTGHRNVHELLEAYENVGHTPPWLTLRHWGEAERDLAARGWVGITEGRVVG